MATSFCGGRRWSTRREPPTIGKQLVNFIKTEDILVYTPEYLEKLEPIVKNADKR
jgi:hypothetical protein